ncbi:MULTISPECIES: hypothetical protein [Paenibacillus]|uniref:hypothetical protein n=1 Tax=Paenibacillus TaxID=44249 RepID=UPI002FDFBBE8
MFLADTLHQSAWTLEANEIFYLADMLGAKSLLDMDNPLIGYLRSGENEGWNKAEYSLKSKGVLNAAADCEATAVAEPLLSSLSAAFDADKACWVKYYAENRVHEQFLHITEERVVSLERLHENPALHRIDEFGCLYQACGILAGKMKWNTHNLGDIPALLLSKRNFKEILVRLDEMGLNEIMSRLAKVSDDQEGIIALAKCMKTRVAHGSLRLYTRGTDGWESQSAQFINNHHMNWLIRSSTRKEEDWLIATPTPNEAFQDMMRHWFEHPKEALAAVKQNTN